MGCGRLRIRHYCKRQHGSQMRLRSGVAVMVAEGSSCSSDLNPSLGTSTCRRGSPKKENKQEKKKKTEQKHLHGIVLENCKCISILRTRYFCHTQKIGLSHSSSNCKCRSSGQQWVPVIGLQSTPVLSRWTVAEGSVRKVCVFWGGSKVKPNKAVNV